MRGYQNLNQSNTRILSGHIIKWTVDHSVRLLLGFLSNSLVWLCLPEPVVMTHCPAAHYCLLSLTFWLRQLLRHLFHVSPVHEKHTQLATSRHCHLFKEK